MREEGTAAGAGTVVQRSFEPQHLHDAVWWATSKPCATLAAAIARAKTANPDHCNGGVIRVVHVVVRTKATQVWDKTTT